MKWSQLWSTVRIADAAEIVEAQKLRYETYVEEKAWGDRVQADHEARTLPEDFDTHPASRVWVLGEDGRVDGAMRTTVWPAGEMPEARRRVYSLDRLPGIEGLRVAEASNFMVTPPLRKSMAPAALMMAALNGILREQGAEAVLMFCTPGLLPRYLEIGLRPYGGRPIAHLTGALLPMVGLPADVAHSMKRLSLMALPQALHRMLGPKPSPAVAEVKARLDADRSVIVAPAALEARLDAVRAAAPDSWLASLDPRVVRALAHAGLALSLPPQTLLIEPGVSQQELFIVLEGECEVLLGDDWVRPMGPGTLFGELAALRPEATRTAAVRTAGDTQVLMLPRRFLQRLSAQDAQAALDFTLAVARLLSDRLLSRGTPVSAESPVRGEVQDLPVYRRAIPPVDPATLLDANEHPGPLPPALDTAVREAVAREVAANRYPDATQAALRAAGAAYVAASAGLEAVSPSSLSFGAGSDELIRALLLATIAGGRGRVLVSDPTFGMVGVVARAVGGGVARVGRLDDGGMDTDAADAAIADPQGTPVRMVYVASPNSPTGQLLLDREVAWLRALPPSVLVVVDEAYFELAGSTLVADALSRPSWVVLRTLSKGFGLAAWRVGYAVGGDEVIGVLERLRLPFNLSTAHQAAARVVLERHEEALAGVPALIARRDRLWAWLEARDIAVAPSAGNFLWAAVPRPAERAAALAQRGFMVSLAAGRIRITVGSEAETAALQDALAALLEEVR